MSIFFDSAINKVKTKLIWFDALLQVLCVQAGVVWWLKLALFGLYGGKVCVSDVLCVNGLKFSAPHPKTNSTSF
jgi:hypothetical protein